MKINNNNIKEIVSRVNTILRKFLPEWANEEIMFVENNFDSLYNRETIFNKVIKMFAVIVTFVICIGLFGHSSLFIQKKLKQLAIRKVLGAKSIEVTLLILRKYILIIGISSLLAIPIIWKLTDLWLNNQHIFIFKQY